MAHPKYKKAIRQENAQERAKLRTDFLNEHGLKGYVQIRQAIQSKHPNGAVKEKAKLDKLISRLKHHAK
mgnify:FL=1|tara:strand:- start:9071 stop:9277 length:207 start_codon:yes stop_codon:yes gene_type:complete